eukprot:CCRYP_016407-RA/>CCRYP_016407-RA protein AED:0.68 eAED:0.37 QI:0/0/0/1/1/1/2/0/374
MRLHPDPTLVQWHQFKRFWIEKYAEYERGHATMQDAGYHGASNMEDDSNSLPSLTKAFAFLQSHHTQQDLALQALLNKVSSLRQLINNTQASTVHLVPTNIQFPPAPTNMPTYPHLPPTPTYPTIPHPPPPRQIQPPPPTLSTQPYFTTQQLQPYNSQPYTSCSRNYHSIGNRGRGRNSTTMQGPRNNPPHPHPSDAATVSTTSSTSSPTNNYCSSTSNSINITLGTNEAIADSGATAHFFLPNVTISNKRKAEHPLNITLPDGEVIQSTHVGNLNLPGLGNSATLAHVVPGLTHSSLLSIKQLCDNGCHVIFTKQDCKVYRKAELMLVGKHHPATGLWVVSTNNRHISTKPPSAFASHASHNAYQTTSKAKLI